MKNLMIEAGFSDKEAEIYIALLKLGYATVDDCAKVSGLPRATAYRAIRDVLKRGLIVEIAGKPVRYYPLSPREVFGALLQDRINELEREKARIPAKFDELINEAESLYENQEENFDLGGDLIVLHGKEALRQQGSKIHVFETRKSLYREPLYVPAPLEVQYEWVKEYADKNIMIFLLVESEILKKSEGVAKVRMYLELGHQVRHLHKFPGKMEIMDEKTAILGMKFNENPQKHLSIFVQNNDLVGLLNRAFDSLWEEATPLALEDLEDEKC